MKKKSKTIKQVKKVEKQILEFYYMIPESISAKELSELIRVAEEKQIEVWKELNLMEVVLEQDSLIFQDVREIFEDPLDLAFLEEHNIKSIYQISYEKQDESEVKRIMKELLQKAKGMIASDTDDFMPLYDEITINTLGE